MATEFGGKIKLQGESEYRSALSKINSELKLLSKEMGDNASSAEAMAKKQDLLKQKITEQKKNINNLEQALEQAKKQYGENSTEVQKWETKLNNAKGTLIGMENELKDASDKMKQYSDSFAAAGNKLNSLAGKLSGLSAGAAGALAGVAGIAVKAGVAADDLNTLAAVTGVNTTELQKFAYASDLIDVSIDTYSGSLRKLISNMKSAQQGSKTQIETFKALGIEYQNVDGSLRNNQDVFYDLIDALGAVDNETQRDAYAMNLFGKSAQELNPLIKAGSQTLKDLGNEAEQAGLILSQDALDGLNQFNDGVDRLKAAATADLSRIGAELTPVLLPILEDMSKGLEKVVNWLTSLDKSTIETGLKITAFVAVLAPLLKGLASTAQAISTVISVGSTLTGSFGAIAGSAGFLAGALAPVAIAIAAVKKHEEYLKGENYELLQSLNETSSAYENNIAKIDENRKAQSSQIDSVKRLLPQLEALANKTDRTATEDEQLNVIITKLNTTIPELNLAIDEQTDKLNKNTAEIYNAVQAYKDLAEATSYKEKLQVATTTKLDFEENLNKYEDSVRKEYETLVREKGTAAIKQYGKIVTDMARGKTITEQQVLDAGIGGSAWSEKLETDLLNVVYQREELARLSNEQDKYAKKLTELSKNTYMGNKGDEKQTLSPDTNTKVSDISELADNIKEGIDIWEYKYKSDIISLNKYISELERIRDQYFVKDSKAWRDYDLKILDLKKQSTKNNNVSGLTDEQKEYINAVDYRYNAGIISLSEYIKEYTNIRDTYFEKDTQAWREYDLKIRNLQKQAADFTTAEIKKQKEAELQDRKKAYNEQQTRSYNWIDDRILFGDFGDYETDEKESYDRILVRAKQAYQDGIISMEEFCSEIERIATERKNDYTAQKQRSLNFIDDRNFYDDWEQFNTDEEESYRRMLERADEYYAKGILSYEEYLSEVRELNKSIYTAQANEQEEIYNQTEERLSKWLSDKKTAMDNQISDLNKQVSDLRSKYTTENRNKELSELQAEAKFYKNSVTSAGQEHYKSLTDQIEKLQQEAEIEELERKNNEIIAQLQADYAQAEAMKENLLTRITDSVEKFTPEAFANAIGGIFGNVMTAVNKVLNNNIVNNNITNSNTNNITQNNNINDKVDLWGALNIIAKKMN